MKQLRSLWVILFSVFFVCGIAFTYFFIDVPDSPQLASTHGHGKVRCHDYQDASVIDASMPLNIAVWNIYKQQLDGWDTELKSLAAENEVILLQEAQSRPEMISYIEQGGWHSNQAYAFAINGEIAGVMTLSKAKPQTVCAYTKIEPYLRLPKSALYSAFKLSNGEILSVINLHSINFTYGVKDYSEQLDALVEAVKSLEGPLIVAGDLNTWSNERQSVVKTKLGTLGLLEARFQPDQRLRVFNHPLDHFFYRGMLLESARSVETEASDHAKIEVRLFFAEEKGGSE
ncbi:endonuclease/exonuclease/phosphatase family protein [Grimontia hollisae]|uniref:endonuclease/exonuclease/phosphatase family protein n=1 Tax=Grimontia hollisae TaxID=673 RepID=UPI001302F443|nr:endonuclease/exonuclease/phosphatase family protein [Grimontia hollisae]